MFSLSSLSSQGAYSQYFIFFVTYKLAQKVKVFGTSKPFQLCYTTVKLNGLFRKLQRKWSVVNTVPGLVFVSVSGAYSGGPVRWAPALPANIRSGWRGLPGKPNLGTFEENKFIFCAPVVNFINILRTKLMALAK